ncbi:tetratricopeptide (TPR) repeat protein [Pedobacter sp. UYP30]|uniref:tetratricopeptide repeat protein n=1 Tax=Pedobacter sp. UYP30 TaxID=1756400 RepID=UPI003394FDB3
MNSSITIKQVIIVGAILLLIAFLFTRDIKGLVKPAEHNGNAGAASGQMAQNPAATSGLTLANASEAGKSAISKGLGKDIIILEKKYQSASGNEKVDLAKKLAQKWDDVEQITPSAMYLEVVAENEPTAVNWVKTGDAFMKAYDRTQDSLAQPSLLTKANMSFKNALAKDSTNLDAKTGLGSTIVNGLGMPMQGIAMLLDVVNKQPNNIKANMNLGLFSIKSGQFDKAIPRFKTVIATSPTPEAYFYLATAYENLDRNKEAIAAYLESKKLAADPSLASFIDKKVTELKNKS